MPDTNALSLGAQQLDISDAKKKLEDFEQNLQTKQQDLKLSYAALQTINEGSIVAHMSVLESIVTYLEDMPGSIKPEEVEKLAAKKDAIASLNEVLKELALARSNRRRLDLLENKFGKEVADDVDATTEHLFDHIQKCRGPLVQAEKKIRELRNLLSQADGGELSQGI